MRELIASTLGFIGFVMIAGSAGDCDGACMDQANTLGEMLAITGGGFALIGLAVFIFNSRRVF